MSETQRPAAPLPYPGMPRWVKVSLVVAGVLLAVVVVASLLGVEHGPGRHM